MQVARRDKLNLARLLAMIVALAVSVSPARAQTPTDKMIADVIPRGNKLVPTERIRNTIKTRADTKYSQTKVQDDVTALMATHSFRDVRASFQYTADGKVLVYFDVVELPSVVQEIRFEGLKHAKEDELLSLTGLHRGVLLNPIANRDAVRAIEHFYQDKGRLFAHCELAEGGNAEDSRIVFRISEGPEVKVTTVDFIGNSFVSGDRLRTQINTSRAFLGQVGGTYVPAMIDIDAAKLEEYYRTFGFHDVKVHREITPSADGRAVKVYFHINEGTRYKVAGVQVVGNDYFSEDRIREIVKLKAGDTYDRHVAQVDMKNISDLYGYSGRKVMSKEELVYTGPGLVTVQYTVQERPPDRVGRVIIVGNDVTRENVIRRQVPLYSGQTLEYPALAQAERNLAKLGIFEMNPEAGQRPTVSVLDPMSDNPCKDILVQVQETQTGSVLFSVGVNSDAGVTGSVVLNEKNFDITRFPTSFDELLAGRAFRGAGQEFRLEAVPGQKFQRYTASFREPSLFDSEYSLGTSLYYYNRGYPEYNEQRVGGRATLGRRLNPEWSANATIRLENVDLYDIPDYYPTSITQYRGDHFLAGFRGALTRDTRDSYLRPTEGSQLEFGFEQCVGDYTFPLFTIEAAKYFTMYQRPDGSGRQVLALRSQAMFSTTDDPIYERFYAGGFRSLRGFEFRGVGPFDQGLNVGGSFAFLNSAEYQIPLVASDQLYMVAFVDSGTVESTVAINNYRVAAGVGLRIVVPALGPLPIALDFGIPIVSGPNDREQIFSFWMGFFH